MSTLTTNFGFTKADETEQYDVDVVNDNLDAIDATLKAIKDVNDAEGVWHDYAALINSGSGGMAAGASVSVARWMKIGKTVWVQVEGTCTNAVTNVSITLPNTEAGVPARRVFLAGNFGVFASAAPAQAGHARMSSAAKTHICGVVYSGAFVDAPAGSTVQMNVVYEVL